MHYANGRAAKIGDLVRGKGYNLKYEFTGVLVNAQPNSTTCNAQVATVAPPPSIDKKRYNGSSYFGTVHVNADETGWEYIGSYPSQITPCIEYGQLDAFVAIDSDTGDVLPPQEIA